MHVAWAWFSTRPITPESRGAMRARFESAVAGVVPQSFLRYEIGGDDWGVTLLRPGRKPATRWDAVVTGDRLTAVSLGVPVGVPATETPLSLAGRLLAGEQIHRDLIPPFGLIAIEGDDRFAVQQDWLGMCRLFTAESDGITVLCTRPGMVSQILHGKAEPDLDGWGSYAITSHFGGNLSPYRGVRLLSPGERIEGRREPDGRRPDGREPGGRDPNGRWTLSSSIGFNSDDVVLAGIQAKGRSADAALDVAADVMTEVAARVDDRYDDILLGLSGGKDSRLLAASLIAAGRSPRLVTNEDIRAEGETARELVRLLHEKRGLDLRHTVKLAAPPGDTFEHGLRERLVRLQRRYDFQFPYTFTVRPAVPPLLPDATISANITGAAGELATAYWYLKPGEADEPPELTAEKRLMIGAPGVDGDAVARERERVRAILRHAKDIGVEGPLLSDYIYLVERIRRWCTSAYSIGVITPFLSPALVSLMFSLTTEQKRERLLHLRLTERLVPEWAGIPFVHGGAAAPSIPKVWQGDGTETIAGLIETAQGPIARMLSPKRAERMLTTLEPSARISLQRFAYLAVASEQLEPDAVQLPTGKVHRRVVAGRRESTASARRRTLSRLRWIKRTSAGRAVWAAAKRTAGRK